MRWHKFIHVVNRTAEAKQLAVRIATYIAAAKLHLAGHAEEATASTSATSAPAAERPGSKAGLPQEQGKKLEDKHTLEKKPANPAANKDNLVHHGPANERIHVHADCSRDSRPCSLSPPGQLRIDLFDGCSL